ncbi:MAG: 16S rRNA (guanine(527)-N(7))-methyltransferase RsmG [Deltaproteobacteria bacterium]
MELSQHHLGLIRIYLKELWEWNQHVNLTGLSSRKRIAIELFFDSLIPAPYLPKSGKTLDAGSGAGFPGLPLKIVMPQWDMCLLEANRKKVSFLRHVIRLMKVEGIEVLKGRIEEKGGKALTEKYDIITARALAPLDRTVVWCSPLLRPGGLLVSFLGAESRKALAEAEEVMKKHGLVLDRTIPYILPGGRKERQTLILKRVG